MLLLGVVQAQAIGVPVAAGDFDLLQSEVLTGTTASVTFSGLDAYASQYQHLQLRVVARTSRSSTLDGLTIRFNGDSGTSYSRHILQGGGGSVSSGAATSSTYILASYITANNNAASSFQATVIDILDPYKTTKNTTTRAFGGFASDTAYLSLTSGAYLNTDAITSITLDQEVGPSFVQYSRFSLFGVKKAA